MLSKATRPSFHTLLDAITLTEPDDRDAIIYVETDQPTQRISQAAFCKTVQTYAAGLRQIGIKPRDLGSIAQTQNRESSYAVWGAR